ncbi:MAG TPA: asparaginase [Nocardioidaceae bacterium]|nr:asparaginase [Nocardioidaceae bacterium]
MTRPRISLLALGGTIAMTRSRPTEGLSPALDAADLIEAVPGIAHAADVIPQSVNSKPGASLTFDDLRAALAAALAAVADGADGVVLTQGTDTIEETAYLLDVWWPRGAPLVVTGAMRSFSQPGSDAPANLLDAVATATMPGASDAGVLVTMAGEIHAARYVRKSHSTHPGAFTSPELGPVGVVAEGRATIRVRIPTFGALPPPVPGIHPRVAVIESVLDDDGHHLSLVADGGYDGIVLSGCGVGHVSAAAADVVGRINGRVPVIFASRTESGGTRTNTYQFPGSEHDLIDKGAIPAGLLNARKARLLLWALIASDRSREEMRKEFGARGAG